jgi:hypothetical protein
MTGTDIEAAAIAAALEAFTGRLLGVLSPMLRSGSRERSCTVHRLLGHL